MTQSSRSAVLGGILLVTGTTIGAAMLALPVSTGLAGFFPASLLLVACWIFMTYTSFLILEVNLWMRDGANMITMAQQTLGIAGAILAKTSYLFLLYSLLTAYSAVSNHLAYIFSFAIYFGTRTVDGINRLLMAALGAAYVLLMGLLVPHIEPNLLTHVDWRYGLAGLSVLTVSFGFHIIIPTLTTYLKRDTNDLVRVILLGSALPLIVYALWVLLALGHLPLETLQKAYIHGTDGATLLADKLGSPLLAAAARFFAFFAVITSFLGVALSLWDCLADSLNMPKTTKGRTALYALTFVPPLIFSLLSERVFLTALEYAGAFGVVVLLALLPALMVWRGRYVLGIADQNPGSFRTPGGKVALSLVILVSCLIILVELCNQTGLTQTLLFKETP